MPAGFEHNAADPEWRTRCCYSDNIIALYMRCATLEVRNNDGVREGEREQTQNKEKGKK